MTICQQQTALPLQALTNIVGKDDDNDTSSETVNDVIRPPQQLLGIVSARLHVDGRVYCSQQADVELLNSMSESWLSSWVNLQR